MDRSISFAAVLALALAPVASPAHPSAGGAFPASEPLFAPSLIGAATGAATNTAPRPPLLASYRGIVARVAPSVVTVHSAHPVKNPKGGPPKAVVTGLGSGVVVSGDGDVVTNYHVVEAAMEVVVVLADGAVLPARVIGSDPESDLALLRVDAVGLKPIAIADIEDVQPGDVVLAIGNPLGIGQSVSHGIVSAVVRQGSRPIENFIQTDAAINPGNSGGALVDTAGRLVGLNAVILSHSGGSEGLGFAIPVDLVQTVVASLKSRGRVARGWLGWTAEAAPRGEGARVVAVDRGGPAHRAGIVPGDLVVRIGTRPVHRLLDASNVLLGSDPGTRVPVEIRRHGVATSVDLELAPVPAPQAGS